MKNHKQRDQPVLGTSVQMLGLITAVVTGIVATVQNYQTPSTKR